MKLIRILIWISYHILSLQMRQRGWGSNIVKGLKQLKYMGSILLMFHYLMKSDQKGGGKFQVI